MKVIKFCSKIFGRTITVNFLKYLSAFSRKSAYKIHELQFKFEWGDKQTPEWFDHYCDQFFLFRKTQNPLWVERGVFALLAIKKDSEVLELCCGDGYNTFHFYSIRVKNIISVDFDNSAIKHAIKCNKADNIQYELCDIRFQMPEGQFDNVLWDAGIAHFTEVEISLIMKNIKSRLKTNGILSGYTIVERFEGKSLAQHEYEFKSKEDLRRFFEPHFKNIKVFETIYPTRHNLYFWASDGQLPFDNDWSHLSEIYQS